MLRPRGLHLSTLMKLLGTRAAPRHRPIRLFLCIADHYEPMNGNASAAVQAERVARWVQEYPRAFARFTDSRGRPPQHTFFYPAECYLSDEQSVQHVERITELCRAGFGDVEVHLHHDNDTAENLRETLLNFTQQIHDRHGLLAKDESGRVTYGFIHGNWALDNSRPDGRWCGVNNEITVLRETGCYADFTMPAAPSLAQTRMVNSIYYAIDDPTQPKSHDRGIPAKVGQAPPPDSLLMIQGPLQLDWGRRRFGVLPGLENADVHGSMPPSDQRLQLWLRAGIGVIGRPDSIFLKLHTHGAVERNANVLLGEPMQRLHQSLAQKASESEDFRFNYVTAREMASVVRQVELASVDLVL